jgi:hypothetical protein
MQSDQMLTLCFLVAFMRDKILNFSKYLRNSIKLKIHSLYFQDSFVSVKINSNLFLKEILVTLRLEPYSGLGS